jgi:glycerate kinase
LHEIVPPEKTWGLSVLGACDVDVPLRGPGGCVQVFSPQKGAGDAERRSLERALESLQERIAVDLGIDVEGLPFAGAGGGLGAGLHAFFGAQLVSGARYVLERVGFDAALSDADVVLTGEGNLDAQSLAGKAPGEVACAAAARGIPCLAVAGSVELSEDEWRGAGFARVVEASDGGSDAAARVELAARDLLQRDIF